MAQGDEGRAREWMARALNARRDPAWTADAFVSDHWLPISPVSGRLDAFEWKDPLAGEDHGPIIEHRPESPVQTSALAKRETSPRLRGEVGSRSDPGEGPPQAETSQSAPHPHPLPASSGERERARQAEEAESRIRPFSTGAEQAPRKVEEQKDEEHNGEEKAEEESRRSPFVGGGAGERRRRAAARADESRVRADMTPMTPVAPAVIPLVHAPDDPGPNGDPQPEPEPEIDAPPAEGWRRIRALFK